MSTGRARVLPLVVLGHLMLHSIRAVAECNNQNKGIKASSSEAHGEAADAGAKERVVSDEELPYCETHQCLGGVWRRVVVVGDLHGDYANTYTLLRAARVIDEHGKWAAAPWTLLVQTGDIVDRGPDSLKIFELFQRLRKQAKQSPNHGTVVQLIGNHEVLNLCGRFHHLHPLEIENHYGNSIDALRQAWSPEGALGSDIRDNFLVALQVGEVVFVHAGLVPKYAAVPFDVMKERLLQQIDEEGCPYVPYPPLQLRSMAWDYKEWQEEVGEDRHERLDVIGELGPTWTRLLTMESQTISCEMLNASLELIGNGATMMVVGHTPTVSGSIERRCDDSLILVDTAISRYMSDKPRCLVYENGLWKEVSFTFGDATKRRAASHTRTLMKHVTSASAAGGKLGETGGSGGGHSNASEHDCRAVDATAGCGTDKEEGEDAYASLGDMCAETFVSSSAFTVPTDVFTSTTSQRPTTRRGRARSSLDGEL